LVIWNWPNTVAGFIVGMLVGFTGVGGGALMTPVLVLLFGVAPQTAVGTDLLYATVTKSVGSSIHGALGAVDWYVLRRLWLGSLPAAALTLVMLNNSHLGARLSVYILPVLSVALILTGLTMLASIRLWERLSQSTYPERLKPFQSLFTVLAGSVLGFMVTLTSVGAGAVGVVMLVYLYPKRLRGHKLVGTDIAHAIPLTLLGGLGHAKLGHVDFGLLVTLLLGSIPGIIVGALLSHRVSTRVLRTAIAIMLVVVGAKMLWR
jgi:uncharacterized membrane protein YfcA